MVVLHDRIIGYDSSETVNKSEMWVTIQSSGTRLRHFQRCEDQLGQNSPTAVDRSNKHDIVTHNQRSEVLKALDIVGLSWLTRLFSVAWRSGTVPVEC